MKKVLVLLLSVGIFAFVACGESAEKKAAREKAVADSIMAAAQADSIANAAMMVDSASAMVDSAAAMIDSAK